MSNLEELLKRLVWEKGSEVPGRPRSLWREDPYGFPIKWNDYGKETPTGWEKHHYYIPRALGGPDALWNLVPLQSAANARLQPEAWRPSVPKREFYSEAKALVDLLINRYREKSRSFDTLLSRPLDVLGQREPHDTQPWKPGEPR